jgi:hypothetical protein
VKDIIKAKECPAMMCRSISLGKGIGRQLSSILIDEEGVSLENIWQTITDFGINREDLKKLQPTYKELFEIYSAIKAYRISVKYLKNLKNKL